MYHRVLRIGLFGLGSPAAREIGAVPPLERFTHEVTSHAAATRQALGSCDIAIVDHAAAASLAISQMSEAVHGGGPGFKALVIVAPQAVADAFTADTLDHVDAIWPDPLSADRARFELERLMRAAKREADAYLAGAYLDTLIDSMPEMVWFKALDGEHVKVNSYFCDIVDKARDDVEGRFHNYIWNVPPEDWEKAELTCKESDDMAIRAGKTMQCEELVSTHGEIRTFDTYKTPIFDEDGSVLGTSGFAHDITVERELQRLAWLNARTDYLTGLYNRRYFYEYMEAHEADGPFAFVMIDLDNFKDVNDGAGHDVGDNTLLLATEVMREAFPGCPIVRWGGDEFIIVVPAALAESAGAPSVTKLISALAERSPAVCSFPLTASAGIAVGADGETVDETVKRADDALYRAKEDGKARFAVA